VPFQYELSEHLRGSLGPLLVSLHKSLGVGPYSEDSLSR
jgi:hypothetical protein